MPSQQKPIVLTDATRSQCDSFHRSLLKWFDANQRDLPWRKKKTPYRIWVSEIMLQQTQVATVIDYYLRFMKQFPTVKKLAAADESEVLKLWEGLGYYRRARQLHAAAKIVVKEHKGKFPQQFDEVLALPGIGRYTAGAILSISLDQPHPILEGNTVRLFARLTELRDNPKISASQKQLWKFSESLVPTKRAGDFNQALMELGSKVCTPKSPKCEDCPVIRFCPTFRNALQDKIPAASTKIKYENLHEAVVLVSKPAGKSKLKFLVRLCGPNERWTGLWDFPRFEIDSNKNAEVDLEQKLHSQCGLEGQIEPTKVQLKHAVTKYRITLDVYRCEKVQGRLKRTRNETFRWSDSQELAALPMSITGRKIADRCCENGI